MLEEKDIQKLKEELVTKEDLKQSFSDHFVKEMEVFATKEDLKELKQDVDALREQIQILQHRLINWFKPLKTFAKNILLSKANLTS